MTGGSKLEPRGIECRLLGYAGGRGNYKVQDINSNRVFVSRDVVFEEGQPHRTSPSVGENNIPLFDVAIGVKTLDKGEEVKQIETLDEGDNTIPDNTIPENHDDQHNIPVEAIR